MIPRFLDAAREKSVRWVGIVLSVSLLGFVTVREINAALTSPLLHAEGLVLYCFSIPITFLGTIVPILALGWVFRCLVSRSRSGLSICNAFRMELTRSNFAAGLVLLIWILLSPMYLLIEDFVALSVVPLTTPVCALLGFLLAETILRKRNIRNRVMIICLMMCGGLGTEYVDWNPRKPMMRDLYRIRVGMTVAEVKRIMASHLTGYGEPDDVENRDGRLYYISGRGASYNADIATITFHEGTVIGVDFSHD